jgi:hypothetical protein
MKKHDMIMIGLLILVFLPGFGGLKYYHYHNAAKPRFAEITQNNVLVKRINLNEVKKPEEFILPGRYHEIVQVQKNRIRFKETHCPDQICVRSGWLQQPGEIAICMPNKAVINITEK